MSSINVACGVFGDGALDDTELIRAYDKSVKHWKKNRNEDSKEWITAGPGPWVAVKEDTLQNISQIKTEATTKTVNCIGSQVLTKQESKLGNAHQMQEQIDSQILNSVSEKPKSYREPTDFQDKMKDLNDFMPHFPVPPLPASLARQDGSFNYEKGEIPALLMSWYMAGYQAGYFDAKRDLGNQETLDYNNQATDN